jgi:hypothetical protein
MFRKLIVIIIFLVQGLYLFATIQESDFLIYNGKKYEIIVYPMEYYFDSFPEKRPPAIWSSLWRGYVATFEIIQNKLWVIDIHAGYVSIINEVLDGKDRMKIDWFNGLLVIPQGKRVRFEDMGFQYVDYFFLEIKNGNFIRELHMDDEQFIELQDRQFEKYKKSEDYRWSVEFLMDEMNFMNFENRSEEEIENYLKIFIMDYLLETSEENIDSKINGKLLTMKQNNNRLIWTIAVTVILFTSIMLVVIIKKRRK